MKAKAEFVTTAAIVVCVAGWPMMSLFRLLMFPYALGGLFDIVPHVFFHGRLQVLYLRGALSVLTFFLAAPASAAAGVLCFKWRPLLGSALMVLPALDALGLVSFGLVAGPLAGPISYEANGDTASAFDLLFLGGTLVPFTLAAALGVIGFLLRLRTRG